MFGSLIVTSIHTVPYRRASSSDVNAGSSETMAARPARRAAAGSKRACGPLPPAARTPSGSSRWRRRSASPRAASTGTSTTGSALLEEMLDTWERREHRRGDRARRGGGRGRGAKLRRLFALASSSRELLKIDLAIRDWARRDQAVAERLRRVDNRRMDYMRSLFGDFCPDEDEVEARCLLVFSLFDRQPLHRRRSRRHAAARTCWSSRWSGCWRNSPRCGCAHTRPSGEQHSGRRHTRVPRGIRGQPQMPTLTGAGDAGDQQ